MARKWAIHLKNGDEDRGLLNDGIGKTCIYDRRDEAVRDVKWLMDCAKARKSETVYEVVVYAGEDPAPKPAPPPKPARTRERTKEDAKEGLEALLGG